jgi:hypothetical protein
MRLILIILLSLNSFALELNFNSSQPVVGEAIEAEIVLEEKIFSPVENRYIETSSELKEIFLGNYFYIDKVIDGIALVVPLREIEMGQKYSVVDKKNNFQIRSNYKIIKKSIQKKKEFIVLDQEYTSDKDFLIYHIVSFLVAILALLGAFYYLSRKKIEKQKIKEEVKLRNEFSDLIKNAVTRDEIEIVVWKAKKYNKVIPVTSSYDALKKNLEKIQYKKDWSSEEKKQIEDLFNKYKNDVS